MKKIGILADIHANLDALEAVLEDMPRVHKTICAGDLVGYGSQPNEVIELVKSKRILTSVGNHDHAVGTGNFESLSELAATAARWTYEELNDESLEFLKKLKQKIEIEVEGYDIFVTHGTPRNPLNEYMFPGASNRALVNMTQGVDADIIISGHTHVPLERVIQGKLILNPGSVGQPRDRNPKASYMMIKLGRKKEIIHKRVSYDAGETERKIKDSGLPEEFGTRLHFGW